MSTIAERVRDRLTERSEWQAGMRISAPGLIVGATLTYVDGGVGRYPAWIHYGEVQLATCIPDLTDWPTLGVLIGVLHSKALHVSVGSTEDGPGANLFPAYGKELECIGATIGEAVGALYLAATQLREGR